MSNGRNRTFSRLAIIAGLILAVLLIGYLAGEFQLAVDILTAIGLILIGITILVTIHELGHFLTAKAFGMRVEVFSLGFPPQLFSFKRGDTTYQIGATPLGGYVKISGIIDESLDTEHLNNEPKPWEFRAKPVWQRLIVMTGGVIMNVILGIFIFSMMKMTYGDIRIPMSEVKYGIDVNPRSVSLGSLLGFKTGDELVSFKGESFEFFEEYANPANLLEDDAYFEVRRNGEIVKLIVPGDIQNYFNDDSVESSLFEPDVPARVIIGDTMPNGQLYPAFAAGMQNGDQIIAIDSIPVPLFSGLRPLTQTRANQQISLTVLRGTDTLQLSTRLDSSAILGVRPDYANLLAIEQIEYGFFESFLPGAREAFGLVSVNAQGIRNLGREGVNASEAVLGPLQIAKGYLNTWRREGVRGFLRLTGMLSMILALVNILPIPALDGGHVVFLLIEGITRKEPSIKVRIIAQQIGMVLILGLMIVILFNDFFRLVA